MKQILTRTVVFLFCFVSISFSGLISFPVIAAAVPEPAVNNAVGIVFDEAGLFGQHKEEIQRRASEVASETGVNVLLVTTNSTDGKEIRVFASDFFEAQGFTDQDPGIIFAIDMGSRNLGVVTSEACKQYFPVSKTDDMADRVYEYAADNDFSGGAFAFLDDARDTVVNFGVKPVGKIALIALAAGLIAGGGTVCILLATHSNLGGHSKGAGNYIVRENGLRLTIQTDRLVSTHTSRTEIPKDDDNNHSSGGSFSSSSGGSYSGSSRSF